MAYVCARPAPLLPCLPQWMNTSPRLPLSRWLAVIQNRSVSMVTVVVCPLRRCDMGRQMPATMRKPPNLYLILPIKELRLAATVARKLSIRPRLASGKTRRCRTAVPAGPRGSALRRRVGRVARVADILITERLILRPVTTADQAVLEAHWDTPDVRRFLFDGAKLSPAEITETIRESQRGFAAAGYGLWRLSRSG